MAVQKLVELWQAFAQLYHFWMDISQRAGGSVWSIAVDRGWKSLGFVAAVFLVTFLADYSGSDRRAVMDHLKAVLGGLILVLAIMFAYQMIVTPFKIYKEQSNRENSWHRRSDYFASKVPAQLSIDQQQKVKAIIEPLAGTAVIIQFDADDPYGRAERFANSLAEVFRSASWQVTLTGLNEDRFAVKQGVTLRVSGNAPIGKTQKAVMGAFKVFPEHHTNTLVTGTRTNINCDRGVKHPVKLGMGCGGRGFQWFYSHSVAG